MKPFSNKKTNYWVSAVAFVHVVEVFFRVFCQMQCVFYRERCFGALHGQSTGQSLTHQYTPTPSVLGTF